MSHKAIRMTFTVAVLTGIAVFYGHKWTGYQYPNLWFCLTMTVVLPAVFYAVWKNDDWIIEEAEEIKRRQALSEPKPVPSSTLSESAQNEQSGSGI
jgi:hypothetical protein